MFCYIFSKQVADFLLDNGFTTLYCDDVSCVYIFETHDIEVIIPELDETVYAFNNTLIF